MHKSKYLLFFTLVLSFSGCNKDNNHTSLLGTWNCEEIPEKSIPSIYQVDIVRNNGMPEDSNQYMIYNFYQLGIDEENAVFFVEDSIGKLTITGTNIFGIYIEGTGSVASDFSKIDWKYTVNKDYVDNVRATYY